MTGPESAGEAPADVVAGTTAEAARDTLLAELNLLLEAERAGAKVALASRKAAAGPAHAALMAVVQADEARWCAMLSRQIRRLGGEPTPATGTFREKALAIADPLERLAFLNRGQAWVMRRLDALMPLAGDAALRADLRDMAESHRLNIGRTEVFLATEQRRGESAK